MKLPLFDEWRKKFSDQKEDSLQYLEIQKKKYQDFFDAQIARVSKNMNLISEATRKKAQLLVFKESILKNFSPLKIKIILSAPIIYSMIIPAVMLDVFLECYHQICFRLYGVDRVRRRDHIIIDRHHLSYLNGIEKINCMYCGYFNGLMSYAREIAGRTEKFFCPIKHAKYRKGHHEHYSEFVEYLDGEGYREKKKETLLGRGE